MTDYKPISCSAYDVYEIAIMHKSKLRLVWRDDNVLYDQTVTPLNLQTIAGEEYLLFTGSDGEARRIRLDHIRKAEPA
jgi:Rho-binding antiterminator